MPGEVEPRDQLVWRRPRTTREHLIDVFAQYWDCSTATVIYWTHDRRNARRFTRVEAARVLLVLSEGEDVNWVVYGSESLDVR